MDPVILIGASTSIISVGLVLAASLIIWRRVKSLEGEIREISQRQKEVKEIENKVLAKDPSYTEFEKTVSDLAERLFSLAKSAYEMEEVTTYQEMIDRLDDLETQDETPEELIGFFEKVDGLKYSEKGLKEAQKALIRQSAYNLIRKVEPSPEE